MIGFLVVVHTIVSILLISLVLMQASQGGGLSGTFGGQAASSILGGQGAGNILSKITGWLAAIFIGLAILISTLSGPTEESNSSLVKKASEESPMLLEQNSSELEEKQPVLDLE